MIPSHVFVCPLICLFGYVVCYTDVLVISNCFSVSFFLFRQSYLPRGWEIIISTIKLKCEFYLFMNKLTTFTWVFSSRKKLWLCKLIFICTSQRSMFFGYLYHAKSGRPYADWGWEGRRESKWRMGAWEKIRDEEDKEAYLFDCFQTRLFVKCLSFEHW